MKPINEMTREDITSDEVIKYILAGESQLERTRRSNEFLAQAKKLKCTTEFRSTLKSAVDDERRSVVISSRYAMANVQFAHFDVKGTEYNFACPGWTVDERGIYRINENGIQIRAAYRPIFVKKILKNIEDEKEKVKVCYLDSYGEWRERIFDRQYISSGARISMLASYGVDVTTESSKRLVEFLSDIENNNLSQIERGLSTGKFGWKTYEGKLKFIPYDTEIEFDSNEQFHSLTAAIKPQGKYEKWLELAKKIRCSGRKEPFVYLVAAFSSILVKPLGLLPFIVNLWTETGKGKTVALMFACSVWGNPEEGQYLSDPTSTRTALERRCTALNNLPMMIDDLSKMKDGVDADFTSMIYFLCGGKGKERSAVDLSLGDVGTWKNCILTNMERPLATETMRGGAVNRILDFQSEPGNYFMFDNRDKGREIVKTLKANYGFSGQMFVEIIKSMQIQKLKDMLEGYVTQIKDLVEMQGTAKEEKQILPMALLLLTDELVEQKIFKDGQRLDLEWCVNQLKDVDSVSENQRAYEDLISTVSANAALHFPSGECHSERWGFFEGSYVWILPTAYRQIADRCNFSTTALANWALKENLLKHDMEQGRIRLTKKRKGKDEFSVNYYVFKMPEDDGSEYVGDRFDAMSEEEKTELPFL